MVEGSANALLKQVLLSLLEDYVFIGVGLSVGLSVRLSVSKLTQKLMDGF